MPETKNNRRVRFTRSALREALIDLILEKPLVSITVKDICARADINRSTFYLHFKDVTDILRTTEDEIIEHMREHTPTHKRKLRDLQEIEGFFTDFLEQIRNNLRIMKVIQVLCSEQGDPYFVRKLQTMTYESLPRRLGYAHDAGNKRAAEAACVFVYHFGHGIHAVHLGDQSAGYADRAGCIAFDGADVARTGLFCSIRPKKCFSDRINRLTFLWGNGIL